MRTGIPICEFFSDPRTFAYGDLHMHTAIPVWGNYAYGDTRLDFPYGNIPRMHTVSD
jgi:hypothetical protein